MTVISAVISLSIKKVFPNKILKDIPGANFEWSCLFNYYVTKVSAGLWLYSEQVRYQEGKVCIPGSSRLSHWALLRWAVRSVGGISAWSPGYRYFLGALTSSLQSQSNSGLRSPLLSATTVQPYLGLGLQIALRSFFVLGNWWFIFWTQIVVDLLLTHSGSQGWR